MGEALGSHAESCALDIVGTGVGKYGGGRLFDGFMLGPAEAQQKVQLMASKMSKDDGKALPSLPFTAAAAS